LANFAVPALPLTEQRRITAALDQAELLRTTRSAALAQLDGLTQAVFVDLFGSPQSILQKWPVAKLGELLDFMTSGSRGWAKFYSGVGDIFLRIQNVCRDALRLDDVAYVKAPETAEARRTRVLPGDVLLSITADLGRTAVIPAGIGTAFINQHLSILRTKAVVPRYLSAYLSSPAGQREVLGRNKHAVKAGLNFDDIRSFQIPMPPFDLQREFARRGAAVEKLKTAHRTALAELDALFASLQHRAFRGEL
jgi:type I restriction enzyme S subunit